MSHLKDRFDTISAVIGGLTLFVTSAAAIIRYHSDISSLFSTLWIELAIAILAIVLLCLTRWSRDNKGLARYGLGQQVAMLTMASRHAKRQSTESSQLFVLWLSWLALATLILSILGYLVVVSDAAIEHYNFWLRLQMIKRAIELERHGRYYDALQELKTTVDRFPSHPDNRELETKIGELTGRGEMLARAKAWKDLPANKGRSLRKYNNARFICSLSEQEKICEGLDQVYGNPAESLRLYMTSSKESCQSAVRSVPTADRFLLMDRADRLWIVAGDEAAFPARFCEAMNLKTAEDIGYFLSRRWGE